ncbi:MAG: enoyl-CoA hydratase [Acidimicrobiia bacterium BACL6 MAG-120924-bin43]|uniref:Enoyl-CoA hydratase n=1 Tax=Acidimicrobiia bacterium BACL6 MAG-120924-bin43 TaxID=1655583 RepID=A0A0R2QF86_9ACTN|nr:MAG: enoyl-CoA hydratase [Acidimicrobiia bacterium BACL6 MAG-120924-bin43]KRO57023.1 MAG: enoyl-CoA hydratase [Acidimicrobiia bacterium BACL6 MAG-120322-bin79]
MNRADKRNALDNAMFASLCAAGEYLKTLDGLRVVVLSGDGASFCAGLDFSSFAQMAEAGAKANAADNKADNKADMNAGAMVDGRITHMAQQVCWVWQEVPVPVIAAVHGHALGGGIQIALGADIRIVHPDTQLSVREVHWGLIPDMTGTLMLSRLVRPDIAKNLVFTARVFSGHEAHEMGLVTQLSQDVYADAMTMAREIAGRSPEAVRGAKKLINLLANSGAAEQFAAERAIIGQLIGTANQAEAVMSHFEKRPPNFVSGSLFR